MTDPELTTLAKKVVEKMESRKLNQQDIDTIATTVSEKTPAPTDNLSTEAFQTSLQAFFEEPGNLKGLALRIFEQMVQILKAIKLL